MKGHSILYIEDDPDLATMLPLYLRAKGYQVLVAMTGTDGLRIAQAEAPDLILLDLSMPTMDGWEMRRRLKADPEKKHIPVVALSAHAMDGDKERVLNAGFDGYLSKPSDLHAVERAVQRAIADLS